MKRKRKTPTSNQSRLDNLTVVRYFRNLPGYVSLGLFVMVLAVLSSVSSLLQVQQVGEIAIGVYFLMALVFKIDSRTTFKLALITLIGVALMSAIDPENEMTDTLAVYTYLLLVVGVVTAIVESIRDGRNHGKEAVETVKAGAQFVRRGLTRSQVRPVKYMARTALKHSAVKPQYVAPAKPTHRSVIAKATTMSGVMYSPRPSQNSRSMRRIDDVVKASTRLKH